MTDIAAALLAVLAASCAASWTGRAAELLWEGLRRSRLRTLRRRGPARPEPIGPSQGPGLGTVTTLNLAASFAAGLAVENGTGSLLLGCLSAAATAGLLFFSEVLPRSPSSPYLERGGSLGAGALAWTLGMLERAWREAARLAGLRSSTRTRPSETLRRTAAAGEGVVAPQTLWVRSLAALSGLTVADLMTPHSRIRLVPDKLPLSKTKVDAGHWKFSRIPVCRDDAPDKIVGVVYRREVFSEILKGRADRRMEDLMHPVLFLRDDQPAHEALGKLLTDRGQIACVRDGSGRLVGLVTLEDVLQALAPDGA